MENTMTLSKTSFEPVEAAIDPLPLFAAWMRDAEVGEINDPNAAALATATRQGTPSVRMVLMKHADERGFCFYTNAESRKGNELMENPQAAMCFHWKSLRRQVRVEGVVRELSPEDADEYFHSRNRLSQLGATVSQQSKQLESRAALEEMFHKRALEYPEGVEIPRPECWRGFALQPESIEFWLDGANRLHDRIVFVRHDGKWNKTRLFP
jgi:pyridoxamine 5'-phosphate oxidase